MTVTLTARVADVCAQAVIRYKLVKLISLLWHPGSYAGRVGHCVLLLLFFYSFIRRGRLIWEVARSIVVSRHQTLPRVQSLPWTGNLVTQNNKKFWPFCHPIASVSGLQFANKKHPLVWQLPLVPMWLDACG